jgi:hypothetical protein
MSSHENGLFLTACSDGAARLPIRGDPARIAMSVAARLIDIQANGGKGALIERSRWRWVAAFQLTLNVIAAQMRRAQTSSARTSA